MILEYIKTLSLLTVPFAIYFAWMKIGERVAASYSWHVGTLISSGIGSVTLINLKDRPLAIFEIHAVMNGLSFHLKKFDPPIILKAMEAITVEAERPSVRYVGNDEYEWEDPVLSKTSLDIYLTTSSRVIKCRRQGPPSQFGFAMNRKLRIITSATWRFNNVTYNKNCKYALTYTEDNRQKTALIDVAGFIHWNRTPNGLRGQDLRSADTVRQALTACGLAPLISPFSVDELHQGGQHARENRSA